MHCYHTHFTDEKINWGIVWLRIFYGIKALSSRAGEYSETRFIWKQNPHSYLLGHLAPSHWPDLDQVFIPFQQKPHNNVSASSLFYLQSQPYAVAKRIYIKCRSDHAAPQLLCCSGLAGQSKMTLMTLPALAAACTWCGHFSPAPSLLIPTLCSAMLNLS